MTGMTGFILERNTNAVELLFRTQLGGVCRAQKVWQQRIAVDRDEGVVDGILLWFCGIRSNP